MAKIKFIYSKKKPNKNKLSAFLFCQWLVDLVVATILPFQMRILGDHNIWRNEYWLIVDNSKYYKP